MKILHRDLKCANVFLYGDGAYKLGKNHKLMDLDGFPFRFLTIFWIFLIRWLERLESCKERVGLYLNWYSLLRVAWGLERSTLWY